MRAIALIVLSQLAAKPSGIYANDIIDLRIEIGPTFKCFRSDYIFLKFGLATGLDCFNQIAEQVTEPLRLPKQRIAEDPLKLLLNQIRAN
jgi:hypothetical protein